MPCWGHHGITPSKGNLSVPQHKNTSWGQWAKGPYWWPNIFERLATAKWWRWVLPVVCDVTTHTEKRFCFAIRRWPNEAFCRGPPNFKRQNLLLPWPTPASQNFVRDFGAFFHFVCSWHAKKCEKKQRMKQLAFEYLTAEISEVRTESRKTHFVYNLLEFTHFVILASKISKYH